MKNLKIKVTVVILLVIMSISTCFADNEFRDVEGTKYELSVKALEELDIVRLYPNGTFLPNNVVTRGEMIKTLIKAYGIEAAIAASRDDNLWI